MLRLSSKGILFPNFKINRSAYLDVSDLTILLDVTKFRRLLSYFSEMK